MQQAKGQLFNGQPALTPWLEALADRDPAYLLHEYNHSEWQPLYANQVIDQAGQLGFSYLGSANLAENFDGILPEKCRKLIQQQQGTALQELVRDLLANQSFRRDVYIKGRDPLWSREALALLEAQRFLIVADPGMLRSEDAFQFRLSFGQVEGNRDWFQSLVQSLQQQPASLAELRDRLGSTALPELLQNLMLLIHKGLLVLVPPERDPGPAHDFNRLLAERIGAGAPYRHLACPVSGNVHSFNDIDLLAFHALQQGHSEAELVACLDASLQALDRKPMHDGQTIEGADRQKVLETMTGAFCRNTLPLMRRLGVLA